MYVKWMCYGGEQIYAELFKMQTINPLLLYDISGLLNITLLAKGLQNIPIQDVHGRDS